jgi:hypothetical protein
MSGRHGRRRWLLLLGLACLAPTPGDIGGCGERVRDLDPDAFFAARAELDCHACQKCGLSTERCRDACEPGADAAAPRFPDDCLPLAHDGEVCLRALRASDCEQYERYVRDALPEEPSECHFCPPRATP